MKKEISQNTNELDFSNDSSIVLTVSEKASKRMMYLFENPPEPLEFLKLARKNYKKNIKVT